jgi:hypothetical protein
MTGPSMSLTMFVSDSTLIRERQQVLPSLSMLTTVNPRFVSQVFRQYHLAAFIYADHRLDLAAAMQSGRGAAVFFSFSHYYLLKIKNNQKNQNILIL